MKTIKYLGGIHALADGEDDIYLGHDTGTWKPVNLTAGEEADVTDEKAAQLAEDFPGCFAVDGKTSGTKPKVKPRKSDDSNSDAAGDGDGDGDEDLAGKLLAHSRAELNAAADKLGIADADQLPNKAAVVEAIIAAKKGNDEE